MYKSVTELTREQLIELKQDYCCDVLHKDEGVYWSELADADENISDETVFACYADTLFTDDDFCCTAGHSGKGE